MNASPAYCFFFSIKQKANVFFCVKTKLFLFPSPPFFFNNKTPHQPGQWDSFLWMSSPLLSFPMSCTVLSPSAPPHNSHFHRSVSASGFVSSLEHNFHKGPTCLTFTSSEPKYFSQLVFLNRTDCSMFCWVLSVLGFFLYKSVFLTAHGQHEDPCPFG